MRAKPYVVEVRVYRQNDNYIVYSFDTINRALKFSESVRERWLSKTSIAVKYL